MEPRLIARTLAEMKDATTVLGGGSTAEAVAALGAVGQDDACVVRRRGRAGFHGGQGIAGSGGIA